MTHIHVHLHRTADAGTSEGAKKAAQTRASHYTQANTRQHHETLLNRGYRRVGSGGWGEGREDEYRHPSGHTVIVKQSGGFKNEYGPDIGKTSKELESHLKKIHGK